MLDYKTIIDPATGRMRTVDAGENKVQENLQRTRRELRDMLTGQTPFHIDKLGPGGAEPLPKGDNWRSEWDQFLGFM